MGKKFVLVTGLALGYVLGARAGRQRYEQIRSVASKLGQSPMVGAPIENARNKVRDAARRKGEEITDRVVDSVKERLFGTHPRTAQAEVIDVQFETIEEEKPKPKH